MFIQTELTPNPKTVKFIPGKEVSPKKSVSYKDLLEAENSPLAKKLFLIEVLSSTCCNIDNSLIESTGKTHGMPFNIKPPIIAINIGHVINAIT